jgi:hypothetical protein
MMQPRHLYGKSPNRNLLHHQLDERKYFDSGDFALAQARRGFNIGQVKTGAQHPIREHISHPESPMPGSSNMNKSATQNMRGNGKGNEVQEESGLLQMNSSEMEKVDAHISGG